MGGGQAPNRGFNDREELSFCQMDKTNGVGNLSWIYV